MKELGYITLKEASEISGIKYEALKRRCQTGGIPGALKDGNTWFVPKGEIVKDAGSEQDFLIRNIISLMVENGLEFDITFFVNGLSIGGHLISKKRYLEEVQKKMTASAQNSPDVDNAIAEMFEDVFEKEKVKVDNEDKDKLQRYIHLKDAKLIDASNEKVIHNGVLRLKIDEIDGFMWGVPNAE